MHRTNLVPRSAVGWMLLSLVLANLGAAGPLAADEVPGGPGAFRSVAPPMGIPPFPGPMAAKASDLSGPAAKPTTVGGITLVQEQAPAPRPQGPTGTVTPARTEKI